MSRFITALLLLITLAAAAVPAVAQTAKPNAASAGAPAADGPKRIDLPFLKPVPMAVVLNEIQTQTGIQVSPMGESSKAQVAVAGEGMTIEEALTRLAQPNKMVWRKTAKGYEIWDQESYDKVLRPTLTQQKVFIPVHISGDYLFEAIKQSNILTEKLGTITLDKRTNQVVVIDLPERLALVQDMVNLLDVPQYTRVFYIRYANLEDVAKKIEQFKSEPGTIEVDPMAHLIIVRDVLANIQRMESMIEVLDVRQPRRVYNLNSIGIEEEEMKALDEQVQALITEDAYYYIDTLRGQLILEDTPEVHEDVEKFLRVFDKPVRQVLIQAELLDVKQNNTLSFGTEMSFSGDLVHAFEDNLFGEDFLPDSSNTYPSGTPFGFFDYKSEYPIGTSGEGGLSVTFLNKYVKAQLTAALTDTNTRSLLKPRLLVKNRQKASIHSGTQNPIVNQTNNYNNTSGNYSYSQQYVSSGLTLEVEPTISATDLIEVSLKIENSDANRVELQAGIDSNGNAVTLTGVEKTEDTVSTVLIIPSGETRVISGILNQGNQDITKGVPGLVNIPWIGPFLFGSKSDTSDTRNLLFFITPTIVEERGTGELVAMDFKDFDRPTRATSPTDMFGTQREEISVRRKEPVEEAKNAQERILREFAQKAQQTDSQVEGRRFEAPLPSSATSAAEAQTAPTTPEGAEKAKVNTESELKRFLQEGGGNVPEESKSTDPATQQ